MSKRKKREILELESIISELENEIKSLKTNIKAHLKMNTELKEIIQSEFKKPIGDNVCEIKKNVEREKTRQYFAKMFKKKTDLPE